MTSLAFGFGVLPLTLATGAGAGAQNAIGTGVLGGMVTATVLVIIFAPLFYVLIEKLFGKKLQQKTAGTDPLNASHRIGVIDQELTEELKAVEEEKKNPIED